MTDRSDRPLARLAAGTILVGFDGTRLDAQHEFFARAGFAGYLLFARNIENLAQTRALTDSLRALHGDALPPLIAVDQEGGRIARLQDDVEVFPPMMALGTIDDPDIARQAGAQMAHDLRRAGFSLNFAPVLDLATPLTDSIIGSRAFGSDPVRVAALAGALANGLTDGGIVATFKHFPGHGSTIEDSHLGLPVVELEETEFRATHLAPFAALLPGARAVMSAHIVVRAIDPSAPATLSHRILTEILRRELHFEGVCFTDCMQMDAIARGVGSVAGVVAAIAAGADCALVSHDPQLALAAVEALVGAVEAGTLARARLEEAGSRISRLRSTLKPPLALDAPAPYPGIGNAIARRWQ